MQKDLSTTARELVNTSQKDINREFVPVIEQAVSFPDVPYYSTCLKDGAPSYI